MPTQTLAALEARAATASDIPFLARIIYEASLPPHNHSFWDEMLQESQTPTLDFLVAVLEVQASDWGNVEDFLIVEFDARPVAAAAGYEPNPAEFRPISPSSLNAIAQVLGWSPQTTAAFQQRYLQLFGDDPHPEFFSHQAPWLIESVAVLPEARGQGMGKVLLRSLLERGRDKKLPYAGIGVINGNERAQGLYESLGFEPYQTFHRQYFLKQFGVDFPGITKLVLPLFPDESLLEPQHG